MRVAVTGTPGTGKTTATELLGTDGDVIHLNEVIESADLSEGFDEERGSVVADLDAVADWLDDQAGHDGRDATDAFLFESHLAHHFDADRVVVLRAHPDAISDRLRERGEDEAKIAENAESEALDVILSEAVASHGTDSVYEIDTTERDPAAVAERIDAVVAGEREPSAGTVDFTDWL